VETKTRTLDIRLINREGRDVVATLRISRMDPSAEMPGRAFEAGELEVERYGLTVDLCSQEDAYEPTIEVTLPRFSDRTVRAVVVSAEPGDGSRRVATFNVTDEREGEVVGGVGIICASPDYPSDLPSAPPPENPCPLALAAELTSVEAGADPSASPTVAAGVVEGSRPQDLVALVENKGRKKLSDTVLYLEHVGTSGVTYVPNASHIGEVEPGGQFWATWRIDPRRTGSGRYEASLVAWSKGYDSVRIHADYKVVRSDESNESPRPVDDQTSTRSRGRRRPRSRDSAAG
jgi:hypothetical protein